MDTAGNLNHRKDAILAQLAQLGPMRKGSLQEQYFDVVLKGGAKRRRGPYTLYTFKEKGRTVSRRLSGKTLIELYRRQIEAFRSFQELTAELAQVGQRLADLQVSGDEERSKKNSRR